MARVKWEQRFQYASRAEGAQFIARVDGEFLAAVTPRRFADLGTLATWALLEKHPRR
jgi:hypothetical protein